MADASLAAVFVVLLVAEILPNPDMTPQLPLVLGCLGTGLPMAWRRTHPGVVAVVVCVSHAFVSVIATGPFPPQLAILPVLVALYTAASLTRGVAAAATGISTALLVGGAWIATEEGHPDDFWPWMLWAGAWAAGTFVRRRGDVAAHHAARAARLELEAQTAAAESAQAERDRIARDMHDVIAHSVSVMVVQAGAERLRLGRGAGATGEALAAIEESGRTALAELRAMLGVLRDAADEPLAPVPGLDLLPGLMDRVRDAGLPVDFEWSPPDLLDSERVCRSGAGIAAYRIVQEALTNVMRHQGLVLTRVQLVCEGGALSLSVTNAMASSQQSATSGSGRGLSGMHERAAAVGGELQAGERDDHYVVSARLPLALGVAT